MWKHCSSYIYSYFAVRIYTEMEINDIGTDVSVLSCGALERSNNLYIESIVGTCVSNNPKENPKKELRQ